MTEVSPVESEILIQEPEVDGGESKKGVLVHIKIPKDAKRKTRNNIEKGAKSDEPTTLKKIKWQYANASVKNVSGFTLKLPMWVMQYLLLPNHARLQYFLIKDIELRKKVIESNKEKKKLLDKEGDPEKKSTKGSVSSKPASAPMPSIKVPDLVIVDNFIICSFPNCDKKFIPNEESQKYKRHYRNHFKTKAGRILLESSINADSETKLNEEKSDQVESSAIPTSDVRDLVPNDPMDVDNQVVDEEDEDLVLESAENDQ